jgi:hypothetical protein
MMPWAWVAPGCCERWGWTPQHADGPVAGLQCALCWKARTNSFAPRPQLPFAGFDVKTPDKVSYYDTALLIETPKRYADFDRINDGGIRVSVGAVNIRDGNFVYFDNSKIPLKHEHFAASGALPPAFRQ